MHPFLYTLILFIGTVCLHILLHRIIVTYKITWLNTVALYITCALTGLAILYFRFIHSLSFETGFCSLWLFGLLSLDYIIFVGNLCFSEEGPSSKIIFFLKRTGAGSEFQIGKIFSNSKLIDKRLADLKDSRMARCIRKRYFIEPRGHRVISVINKYRKIMGTNLSG
jgi:hypothetical protein